MKMKPESKNTFPGWIKGAFHGGKKEMQESIQQNLSFVLSTAPMWDRFDSVCIFDVYTVLPYYFILFK